LFTPVFAKKYSRKIWRLFPLLRRLIFETNPQYLSLQYKLKMRSLSSEIEGKEAKFFERAYKDLI
jgi:hypothetical protein